MLGSFQCRASLAYLDISRTKACCTSGVVRIFFSGVYHFFPLFPTLRETTRYILKYVSKSY